MQATDLNPTTRASSPVPTPGPKTLAVLRISAGVAALMTLRERIAVPPSDLRFHPRGSDWLDFLPITQGIYEGVAAVGTISALLLIAGWRFRFMAWITCLVVFYTSWVPTLTGKVNHIHHVMWMLVIVAVSPCAHRWAFKRQETRGSFNTAVTGVAAILGLIYFGAGLSKVLDQGLLWGWSDNLRHIAQYLAWEKDQQMVTWLIEYPVASRLLGSAALAFELLFLPLILWPRTRRWVWPAGLLFHWGTWVLLDISFVTLQLSYLVFLPWDRSGSPVDPASSPLQRRVIAALVSAVAIFSLARVQNSWPVASYPGFEGDWDRASITHVQVDGGLLSETQLPNLVGNSRALPFAMAAIRNGKKESLAEWIEADDIRVVIIDTETGVITPCDTCG